MLMLDKLGVSPQFCSSLPLCSYSFSSYIISGNSAWTDTVSNIQERKSADSSLVTESVLKASNIGRKPMSGTLKAPSRLYNGRCFDDLPDVDQTLPDAALSL